jgi:hypothetical protein
MALKYFSLICNNILKEIVFTKSPQGAVNRMPIFTQFTQVVALG